MGFASLTLPRVDKLIIREAETTDIVKGELALVDPSLLIETAVIECWPTGALDQVKE
jgi:hypothetical protein